MKLLKSYIVLLLMLSVLLTSCNDDDDKPKGAFDSGVFVVNEGNFNDADGSVSFINRTNAAVTLDLFGSVNNGLALGDVVQSMTIDDDVAYIVVNNSNKMEVVNANTFVKNYTIDGLALPRYFTTHNGKGYLTEWVSFTDPGRVSVVDLNTHAVTTSITTDFGAENIVEHDGLLYVSNNFSNTVSVIDPTQNKVIKTITVASSPGEILEDSEDKLWVACGGNYNGNDGAFVQIDPAKSKDAASESVIKTIPLLINITPKAAISDDGRKIFYYKGKSVYALNTTDTTAPASALFTENQATSFYGIGIDDDTDVIYVSDSKGFIGNGKVYRYAISGTAIDNVDVGRGPNGFVFE